MQRFTSWQSVLLRITQILGRHARWFGFVIGLLAALFLASLLGGVALYFHVRSIDAGHSQILRTMQRHQADISNLLDTLTQDYTTDCTNENLKKLRALMLLHPYGVEIGLVNAEGKLFCSTSTGLLPIPLEPTPRFIVGYVGRYYLRIPAQRFNPYAPADLNVNVVARGSFQVVIGGDIYGSFFPQFSDAVWAGRGVQRVQVYASNNAGLVDAVASEATPHMRTVWSASGFYFLVTNTLLGISPVSVQSVIKPNVLFQKNLWLVASALLICLSTGWLAYAVSASRILMLRSIDWRIHYLCHASNVVCHYQPIISLATGEIVGCEVLARLRDGEKLLYPDQFIAALADGGLTWQFDSAVCARALTELAQLLPLQSQKFTVALNLFPRNLNHSLLHGHLQKYLSLAQRNDLHINLEVTEYEFSADALPELQRLQTDGYAISIDDFGTGYSNLGVLKRMAPDCLKIDKSFVFEMEDSTIRSSLIPEILAIAKAVGSEVVAEGIETPAQAIRLRTLGVQFGQGYFFSKPVPLDGFIALMESKKFHMPIA